MASPFYFKQFVVHQDRCAMKVGTDGVLLGAWASLGHSPTSVLDIGAGTGLIALMLAQRSAAETVDAVELDPMAHAQCVDNFEGSPWADRLFCYHASFDTFYQEMEDPYDLIVSNPPFYSKGVSSGHPARDQARDNRSLPFEQLLAGVERLLSRDGIFSLIVPFETEAHVKALAETHQLFPTRILRVKGNANAPLKRSLLEFSRTRGTLAEDQLIVETERHQFTPAYRQLTQDFYLKM